MRCVLDGGAYVETPPGALAKADWAHFPGVTRWCGRAAKTNSPGSIATPRHSDVSVA